MAMEMTGKTVEPSARTVYEALQRRTIEAGKSIKPRYKAFVDHWLLNGGNASQAYRDSYGYKGKYAARKAHQLFLKKKVKNYADLVQECAGFVLIDAASCNAKRAFDEESVIAYFDPRRLFNDDGSTKKPSEWPDDVARAIAGIDVDEVVLEDGTAKRKYKIRFWNKGDSLNRIQKCLGMQREPQEPERQLSLKALLSEIDGATRGRLPSDQKDPEGD
jgi:phage terminase small subunit